MGERSDVTVLRSINLPVELEEALRTTAFLLRRPKADLMRYFINEGLAQLTRRMGSRPSEETLRELSQQIAQLGGVASEREGIAADLGRVERALAAKRR